MSRRGRLAIFLVGAGGLAAMFVLAFVGIPPFGNSFHPYRDHAIPAAVAHRTANVVSSINFDQRGLDTLGEESILLGSVVAAAVLLRPAREEQERPTPQGGRTLQATRLLGYVLLPVTILVGFDVVVHGHLTPGGGFQGGVVLATGIHLLYVAGSYPALDRFRSIGAMEYGEAIGAGAFAALGVAGLIVVASFLADVIPFGSFGQLLSGGTVPVLNIAVGLEVASGTIVLLAQFLEQHIRVRPAGAEGART